MTSPCETIVNWNWKEGAPFNDTTTAVIFNRNYFDCGTYYFDGTFNVVKFPKGMTLYHGSATLADKVVEFPVGIKYYKPYQMQGGDNIKINPPISGPEFLNIVANSDEDIEEIVSKSIPITAGWYADPSVAKIYSGTAKEQRLKTVCKGRCINAYKTTKETVFFIMDDDYNIAKLFASSDEVVPEEKKELLMKMFNIKNRKPIQTNSSNPFNRLRYDKERVSSRAWDLPFAEWVCNFLVKKLPYAGYAATVQYSKAHGGQFHLEFMFCDAFRYLDRDLTNILDWQHNPEKYSSDTIKIFMEQLGLYQSVNINFHAGDLLQHSIWTLLFAEEIMKRNIIESPLVDEQLYRTVAFAAFIHDIGKMSPDKTRKNTEREKFIYFSIPTHPGIGSEYILGQKPLPIYDEELNYTGNLNIDKLFQSFGIDLSNKEAVAAAINLHWDFGDLIKHFNEDKRADNPKADYYADLYIKKVRTVFRRGDPKEMANFLYMLLVVSIADINASQPFGVDRLSSEDVMELNKISEFFPFITNMPKIYRGGNVVQVSKINDIGVKMANYILGKFK